MANELFTTGVEGLSLYAVIYNVPAQIYNVSTGQFETPSDLNWTHYAIVLTGNAGDYTADFPILPASIYSYNVRISNTPKTSEDVVYASGTVNWNGVSENNDLPDEPDFLSVPDIKTRLQITVSQLDAAIASYMTTAQDAIRAFLGHGVSARNYTETRNGDGNWQIRAFNPPINSIAQITLDQYTAPIVLDSDNFVFQPNTGIIQFNPNSISRQNFGWGFQNIVLQYNGGWVTVPDPIIQAGAVIVREMLYWNKLGNSHISSKKVGDINIAYRDLKQGNLMTYFAEAYSLLQPYKKARV